MIRTYCHVLVIQSSLGGFRDQNSITHHLEKGGTDDEPALWTHPEFIKNGSIIGEYPPILIQDGDYFGHHTWMLKRCYKLQCNVQSQLLCR